MPTRVNVYATANWLKVLFCLTSAPSDSVIAGRMLLGQKNEDATLTDLDNRNNTEKAKGVWLLDPSDSNYGHTLRM